MSSSDHPSNPKQHLRTGLQTAREALSQAKRDEANGRAVRALARSALMETARTIALYAAFRGEADPRALEAGLRAVGARAAYPRVEGDRLIFHLAWRDELSPTPPWGIPEPEPESPQVELSQIDLFIVPGLGFTQQGDRLGYGKGFYDRTLKDALPTTAVGFAFDCQVVDHIPTTEADQRLDALVTESGLIFTDKVG